MWARALHGVTMNAAADRQSGTGDWGGGHRITASVPDLMYLYVFILYLYAAMRSVILIFDLWGFASL